MADRMKSALSLLSISLLACSAAPLDTLPAPNASPCTGTTALQARATSYLTVQQGQEQQGQEQQGCQQQGTALIGASIAVPVSSAYSGWVGRHSLKQARIVRGQLLGDDGELAGKGLVGALIPASDNGSPFWMVVRSAWQDPTFTDGSTWLYGIDVYDPYTKTSSPFCATDANGVAAAIPIAATFDGSGNRVESAKEFTFACTAGVLAKCYRWGYRPWLTDASGSSLPFSNLHWSCTRMARADYCGDGRSWTRNGTTINVWDAAPAPGPFQAHGPLDPTFFFEAGWTTSGAVCLSKERWATIDPQVAQDCPGRLVPPGVETPAGTVCESPADATAIDSTVQLFNESRVNVAP
jgi:hypothetical protein